MTTNRPDTSCKKDTLICIGEGVHLSGKSLHMVADLFLSPDGSISVAVHRKRPGHVLIHIPHWLLWSGHDRL